MTVCNLLRFPYVHLFPLLGRGMSGKEGAEPNLMQPNNVIKTVVVLKDKFAQCIFDPRLSMKVTGYRAWTWIHGHIKRETEDRGGIWGKWKLMCFFYGKRLRLHWEGDAFLSQPDISLIQSWPGLPFTWPHPHTFIQEEGGQQQANRGEAVCFLKQVELHFLLSLAEDRMPWISS